ncbi:tetratricopeptide repeat protein [Streptomyces sp. NBC_00433]
MTVMGREATALLVRLRELYESAEHPKQDALVRRLKAMDATVSTTSVNQWLLGKALPSNPSVFLALVAHLRGLAKAHGNTDTPADGWWAEQLRLAHEEHGARRGGRPRTQAPSPRGPRWSLPDIAQDFTGRGADLDTVLDALSPGSSKEGVVVIAGMPGVGKTALAIRAAHRAYGRGWFHGVVFVDLHGFSPARELTTGEAAAVILRELGHSVPSAPERRISGLHEALAGESPLLIVLDNAASAGPLQQLVPRQGAGPVRHRLLVTSRDTLPAFPAGRPLTVEPMSAEESVLLLGRALHDGRAAAEPAAATRLAGLCGCLPLALLITAAQLREDPSQSLAAQAAGLEETHRRLGRLSVDDTDAENRPLAVRAAFELSFTPLAEEYQRAFRLLGIAPGPDTGAELASVVLGRDNIDTQALLRNLTRRHLVRRLRHDRWDMHDLLRLYAVETAVPQERDTAHARVLRHYLKRVLPTCTKAVSGRPGERREALAWMDAEHRCVTGALVEAARHGQVREALRLTEHMSYYWELRWEVQEWITAARAVLDAGPGTGRDVSSASRELGSAYRVAHRYDEARPHLERALDTAPDQATRGLALHGLGLVELRQGRYQRAAAHHRQAKNIHSALGDVASAALATIALGDAERMSGDPKGAARTLSQAITLLESLSGKPYNAARGILETAHGNLALALMGWDPFAYGLCAVYHFCRALRIAVELDDRPDLLLCLTNLAALYLEMCPACLAGVAAECAGRVLADARPTDDPLLIARAQLNAGRAQVALGDEGGGRATMLPAWEVLAPGSVAEDPDMEKWVPSSAGLHAPRCTGLSGSMLWTRPLHRSVLAGDFTDLEQTTFYGDFRTVSFGLGPRSRPGS